MKNMALLLALALPVLLPGQAAHPQSVVSSTDIFTGFSNRCNIGIGIMESLKREKPEIGVQLFLPSSGIKAGQLQALSEKVLEIRPYKNSRPPLFTLKEASLREPMTYQRIYYNRGENTIIAVVKITFPLSLEDARASAIELRYTEDIPEKERQFLQSMVGRMAGPPPRPKIDWETGAIRERFEHTLRLFWGKQPFPEGGLEGLERLHVTCYSEEEIEQVYQAAARLPELAALRLDFAGKGVFPHQLSEKKTIRELELVFNEMESLSEPVYGFDSLESLVLTTGRLGSISGIGRLPGLKKLSITTSKVDTFPAAFASSPTLETLELDLKSFPLTPEVLELPLEFRNLKTLHFPHLKTLPAAFETLAKLENLAINGSWLQPEWCLARLKNLKSLKLKNYNRPTGLDFLARMPQLEELSIDSGSILYFSGLKHATRLRQIWLRWINLDELPEEILQLDNLERLYLVMTRVSRLPEALKEMKSLKEVRYSKGYTEESMEELEERFSGLVKRL